MLKIGIADSHSLFRKGLALLVGNFDKFEVVLQASNGEELIRKLKRTLIDVVLIDIQMPIMDGYDTCSYLKEHYPQLKILIVSQLGSREIIHKILDHGAHGYFCKSSDSEQLESAIQIIYDKGFYFDNEMGALLKEIIFREKIPFKVKDPLSMLSEKELNIIKMVGQGYSNVVIAENFF